MRRVVILQEYIPTYRAPFFEALRLRGLEEQIDIRIAYGRVAGGQALRADSTDLDFGLPIQQKEYRLFGKRLVVRSISGAIRDANLVILEQARRNLDSYTLLRPVRPKKPLVALWGHGSDYTRTSGPIDRAALRWLTERADWFFAYTKGGAEAVQKIGFPQNRTTVVQNSIDASTLRDQITSLTPSRIDNFSDMWQLKNRTALFLGGLDYSKRISFLLQAADKAHALDDRFRLLIAGTGELQTEIESWTFQRPWTGYLGPLAGVEKAVALAAAQVLVIPGRVGLVAVDSFASGRPIVTTDWPWHAPEFEYLEESVTAKVTEDDPDVYGLELVNLLSDSEALARLSSACVAAADKYSLENMVTNFLVGVRDALAVGSR